MKDLYQKLEIINGSRHTALLKKEAEFLYTLLKDKKIKKTLEVGMAFGVSTSYIMKATNSIHYTIDPFQSSEKYNNIGLKNINKLGLRKNLKFINQLSCFALPDLCKKELKFEFVLMDGSHKFDDQFVDFYYIDLLLEKNGFLLIHDIWTPQIKTLLSWINTNKINYNTINIANDSFALIRKIGNKKRKWFEFEKFEVFDDGTVSRYM